MPVIVYNIAACKSPQYAVVYTLWLLYVFNAASTTVLPQCVNVYVSVTIYNVANCNSHYYAFCKCYGVQ